MSKESLETLTKIFNLLDEVAVDKIDYAISGLEHTKELVEGRVPTTTISEVLEDITNAIEEIKKTINLSEELENKLMDGDFDNELV